MSSSQIIYSWLDDLGENIRELEFEGKSLGFRAELTITVKALDVAAVGATVSFTGVFRAFAPLIKAPLVDYRIQSEWLKRSSGWRLNSWMDNDEVRHMSRSFTVSDDDSEIVFTKKPGGQAPVEKKLQLNDLRREAGAETDTLMDPLSAVVLGLTVPLHAIADHFQHLFVLQKSGIKTIATTSLSDSRVITFDKTDVTFMDWQEKCFSKVVVNDPRLPVSANLVRTKFL